MRAAKMDTLLLTTKAPAKCSASGRSCNKKTKLNAAGIDKQVVIIFEIELKDRVLQTETNTEHTMKKLKVTKFYL